MYERLGNRAPVNVGTLTLEGLMGVIDHSLLRPELTIAEVEHGLDVALQHNTASVCVRPRDLALAVKRLDGSDVAPTTVVGFPHGAHCTDVKVREAVLAAETGAVELDMVLSIGALRSGLDDIAEEDIRQVIEAVAPTDVKVILETAYLTSAQVDAGCRLAVRAGAAFVKNGTGFSPRGALAAEIARMREVVGPGVGVKAAGGVRSLEAAEQILRAGANRFGATATAAIASQWQARSGQLP